jgi:hypothetical protein
LYFSVVFTSNYDSKIFWDWLWFLTEILVVYFLNYKWILRNSQLFLQFQERWFPCFYLNNKRLKTNFSRWFEKVTIVIHYLAFLFLLSISMKNIFYITSTSNIWYWFIIIYMFILIWMFWQMLDEWKQFTVDYVRTNCSIFICK